MVLRALLPCIMMVAAALGAPVSAKAEGWLDRFNKAMHSGNAALSDGVAGLSASMPAFTTGWGKAAGNFFSNTINEPLSAASYAITLQADAAMVSLRRFGTNLVSGYGGTVDAATAEGLTLPRMDLGLALCRYGVPEGPYVELPVLGPRTVRDGLADLATANLVAAAVVMPVIGAVSGIASAATMLFADEVVTVLIARQIDPQNLSDSEGPEARQRRYLAERASRCGGRRVSLD